MQPYSYQTDELLFTAPVPQMAGLPTGELLLAVFIARLLSGELEADESLALVDRPFVAVGRFSDVFKLEPLEDFLGILKEE